MKREDDVYSSSSEYGDEGNPVDIVYDAVLAAKAAGNKIKYLRIMKMTGLKADTVWEIVKQWADLGVMAVTVDAGIEVLAVPDPPGACGDKGSGGPCSRCCLPPLQS